jgi:hypothetical protein
MYSIEIIFNKKIRLKLSFAFSYDEKKNSTNTYINFYMLDFILTS